MSLLSHVIFLVAAVGMAALTVELFALLRHLRQRPPRPATFPAISILKPLCGADDDLAAHLDRFARLDYPDYELVLGVRSRSDAAWALARDAERRHPRRVRVAIQRGEPGLNPKVNQLITMARAARHDLLVVSDSNVTVERDYLQEIAGHFEDPEVGLVTHPIAGVGERSLGSLLDNLHLSGSVAAGMVAVQRILGRPVVVGKSMAVRRSDLARIGGFEAMRDLLAEDFLMGQRIGGDLGKRIVVATGRVSNVSRDRSVGEFLARYYRWSVIHRMAVGPLLYLGGAVLNPLVAALLALLLDPSPRALAWAGAVALGRIGLDAACGALVRGRRFTVLQLAAVPLKDLLVFVAWVHGLVHHTIEWRGNPLRVLPGTWLERPEPIPAPVPVPVEIESQPG